MKYIKIDAESKAIQLPGFGLITVYDKQELNDTPRHKAIERYFPSIVVELIADTPIQNAEVVEDVVEPIVEDTIEEAVEPELTEEIEVSKEEVSDESIVEDIVEPEVKKTPRRGRQPKK